MKLKTKELTTCALFAALIAVGAFIKIDIPLPMYTMHFTLQWFFVLMAGFLLGAKLASLSVIVYFKTGLWIPLRLCACRIFNRSDYRKA